MKDMGDQDFDNFFKDEFLDFEAEPTAKSWDQIQSKMHKPSRRIFIWLGVAAFVLLGLLFVPFGEHSSEKNQLAENTEIVEPSAASEHIPPSTKERESEPEDATELEKRQLSTGNPISAPDTDKLNAGRSAVAPENQESINGQDDAGSENVENRLPIGQKKVRIPKRQQTEIRENLFTYYPASVSKLSSSGLSADEITYNLPVTIATRNTDTKEIIDKPKRTTLKSFHAYLEGTPFMSYYQFLPSTQDNILVKTNTSTASFDADRLGYQLSAGLEFGITEKISVNTGFIYRKQQQVTALETTMADGGELSQTENGYNFTPSFVTTTSNTKLVHQSVGWHVLGLYQIGTLGNGIKQHIGIGFQGSHLVQHSLTTDGGEEPLIAAPNNLLAINAAYRFVYPIASRWSLSVQPTLNYFLLEGRQTYPVSVRPYSIGLGFGMRYDLQKRIKQR